MSVVDTYARHKTNTARLIIKNLNQVKNNIVKKDRDRLKAAKVALKRQGYILRMYMMGEIRKGSSGPLDFDPLRQISRPYPYKGRLRSAKKPLSAMARAVRYNAMGGDKRFSVEVGFMGRRGTDFGKRLGKSSALSGSHIAIAKRQQEGFFETITDSKRRWFKLLGVRALTKAGNRKKIAKYFFFKASTTTFSTPARPIVEPFWRRHRVSSEANIRANWERKMRGERI